MSESKKLAAELREKAENPRLIRVGMLTESADLIEGQAAIIDRLANHLTGYWELDGKPELAGKLISEARALTKQ